MSDAPAAWPRGATGRRRAFRLLAVQAARDALRRPLALAVLVVLAAALQAADACSGVGQVDLTWGERPLDRSIAAGLVAPLLFAFQGVAVVVIAGLLAADHLARPLAEGSAALWLARPVSRAAYAGARLAGALAVALGAGALLLGGTTALLALRHQVALVPAAAGALAVALGAVVTAALAMTASLALGRVAVWILVVVGVPLQAFANAMVLGVALFRPDVDVPFFGAIDRFGPPLGTALLAGLAPWNPHVDATGALVPALLRLSAWALAGVAFLLLAFRQLEIDG
jgi:hypothetical protein